MSSIYALHIKRLLDIFLSIIGFLLCSWLLVTIGLAYLLTLQFPVLFTQERIGKGNQPFVMYKFRTLRNGAASLQDRRFWLGDFLRFFSLDELPQLWNVLHGDMSLVGPRPLPTEYLPLMNEEQKLRHQVRPGITGWAQINGRHEINWQTKFLLDQYYINHITLVFDIKIMIRTLALLLIPRKDQSLQEKKFEGN
ncbi:MAG: sugar transferase [Bacteroidetes bacterium]|nr:sugar transferase [Bacteroidota bacterium]